MSISVGIPPGNALPLNVKWRDPDGAADAPNSVEYQVFDARSRQAVTAAVPLTPAAEMNFTVPAADLPSSAVRDHRYIVQIIADFGADTHTEHVDVYVGRGLA
jgi:hypothetical protein